MKTLLESRKLKESKYRNRINHKFLQEIGERFKQQKAKWLEEVWRTWSGLVIYEVLEWEPGVMRKRGRLRSKWIQKVEQVFKTSGINNCKGMTKDRKLWRKICEIIKNRSNFIKSITLSIYSTSTITPFRYYYSCCVFSSTNYELLCVSNFCQIKTEQSCDFKLNHDLIIYASNHNTLLLMFLCPQLKRSFMMCC